MSGAKCTLLVAALLSIRASAALGADDIAGAKEHFNNGKRLYDVGRFAEAAKEYELAYQAKDDPALLFNLGQAYRLAGDSTKATLAYRAYLRNTPDAANRVEVEALIHQLQADRPKSSPSHGDSSEAASNNRSASAAAPSSTLAAQNAITGHDSGRLVSSPNTPRIPAKPIYKRWWPWTVGGVVLAGAAVGIALALTLPHSSERILLRSARTNEDISNLSCWDRA